MNGKGGDRLRLLQEMTEWTRRNVESLHDSVSQLHAASQEQARTVEGLVEDARRDGENIRALARVAEAHERG